ncbi:MAG: ScyD/ScyE family protein, partial [Acidobacteria bacterium]
SANVEKTTAGFTLSQADREALAAGERITLSNGGGDTVQIELVANFPDYISDPLPGFPDIVRGSNPFGVVVVGNSLYVTDGGRNLVWKVNLATGEFAPLATFPPVPNPLPIAGPVVEAVPTGIEYAGGRLLVTLFSGVPFPPGVSSVVRIDPVTGEQVPLITGLKTAIEVIVTSSGSYLVLQHSSGTAPFFAGPGVVLRFDTPTSMPVVVADCFVRPTSMVLDERSGILYVAEYLTGRVVALRL